MTKIDGIEISPVPKQIHLNGEAISAYGVDGSRVREALARIRVHFPYTLSMEGGFELFDKDLVKLPFTDGIIAHQLMADERAQIPELLADILDAQPVDGIDGLRLTHFAVGSKAIYGLTSEGMTRLPGHEQHPRAILSHELFDDAYIDIHRADHIA